MRTHKGRPYLVCFGRLALFAAFASQIIDDGYVYAQPYASSHSDDATNAASAPTDNSAATDKSVYEITKRELSDTAITAKLKFALYEDRATSGKDIHVATHEGVVTLWGDVPNADTAKQAELLARSTNGVQGVINMIQFKQTNG